VDNFPPVRSRALFIPIFYYTTSMDKLTYEINKLTEDRICVEVSVSGVTLGLLYYERAKRSFNKKPLSMEGWLCVDAKVEGLYEYGGENITPKDIMNYIQVLIKGGGY